VTSDQNTNFSPDPWWFEAFPIAPYTSKQPGQKQMLVLIGYDISHPKRLSKVAKLCEDYGLRVQYSFFECHLDQTNFDRLWERLNDLIDPEQDRIVAYQLDQLSAKRTLTAGNMVCAEKVIVYLI
jgi:CRISPR-associated protein Cas2